MDTVEMAVVAPAAELSAGKQQKSLLNSAGDGVTILVFGWESEKGTSLMDKRIL